MKYRRIYLDSYSYYLTLVTQGRKPLLIDNIYARGHVGIWQERFYEHTMQIGDTPHLNNRQKQNGIN